MLAFAPGPVRHTSVRSTGQAGETADMDNLRWPTTGPMPIGDVLGGESRALKLDVRRCSCQASGFLRLAACHEKRAGRASCCTRAHMVRRRTEPALLGRRTDRKSTR